MEKCEFCGSYKAHGFIGDYKPCPNMRETELREKLQQYGKSFGESAKRDSDTHSRSQLRINQMKEQVQFWKGKFFEVKNENNSLRLKLINQNKD